MIGAETFATDSFPVVVRDDVLDGLRFAWDRIAAPGTWWTGVERVAIAATARAAEPRPLWNRRPGTVDDLAATSVSGEVLSPLAVDTVERVATEAASLTRAWCDAVVARLGDAPYAELVAVAIVAVTADRFCAALGRALEPLPAPHPGDPSRARPTDVDDDGAWIPMTVPWSGPNVGRALSLVPDDNLLRLGLVGALYAGALGADFGRLVWDHRPLSRPQVELMAARVSVLNECFY